MKKTFLVLSMVLLAFAACKNQGKQVAEEPAVLEISIDELLDQPVEFVGKEVMFTGLADHVCKHGGKRMFVLGETPSNRLRINAGESISKFDVELEGSTVQVTGTFTELVIDETYLNQWEEELQSGEKMAGDKKVHTGEGSSATSTHGSSFGEEVDEGTHTEEMGQIERYRNQLKESGQEKLSFYSLSCREFKVIDD